MQAFSSTKSITFNNAYFLYIRSIFYALLRFSDETLIFEQGAIFIKIRAHEHSKNSIPSRFLDQQLFSDCFYVFCAQT